MVYSQRARKLKLVPGECLKRPHRKFNFRAFPWITGTVIFRKHLKNFPSASWDGYEKVQWKISSLMDNSGVQPILLSPSPKAEGPWTGVGEAEVCVPPFVLSVHLYIWSLPSVDTSLFRYLRETLKTMPTFSILFSSYFHSKYQFKTFRNDVTLQLQDCIRVSTISPAHLRMSSLSHTLHFLSSIFSFHFSVHFEYLYGLLWVGNGCMHVLRSSTKSSLFQANLRHCFTWERSWERERDLSALEVGL